MVYCWLRGEPGLKYAFHTVKVFGWLGFFTFLDCWVLGDALLAGVIRIELESKLVDVGGGRFGDEF